VDGLCFHAAYDEFTLSMHITIVRLGWYLAVV
jgi:hypothetical protein